MYVQQQSLSTAVFMRKLSKAQPLFSAKTPKNTPITRTLLSRAASVALLSSVLASMGCPAKPAPTTQAQPVAVIDHQKELKTLQEAERFLATNLGRWADDLNNVLEDFVWILPGPERAKAEPRQRQLWKDYQPFKQKEDFLNANPSPEIKESFTDLLLTTQKAAEILDLKKDMTPEAFQAAFENRLNQIRGFSKEAAKYRGLEAMHNLKRYQNVVSHLSTQKRTYLQHLEGYNNQATKSGLQPYQTQWGLDATFLKKLTMFDK